MTCGRGGPRMGRWALTVEGFVRDGYVAVRGAFDAATAAACREMIWVLRERGVREGDPVTWPTRLVCGSHLHVPEFLAPYGEAGTSADAQFWRPSVFCRPVAHATGKTGDVLLCHPFVVHTATWPHRGTAPRMIAQPAVHVRDGFALDGSDPSPVARVIVAGLAMPERS